MLYFTEKGRKKLYEIKIHFLGFGQCRSCSGLTSWTQCNSHTQKCTPPKVSSQWGFVFPQRPGHKELEHQALSRLCGLRVHYSGPIWLRLSTTGEAANCQLLCPHYPRPPAQTGALGHCPRNHSGPSGAPGKLDKWKAGGGRSRAATHPLLGFFLPVMVRHMAATFPFHQPGQTENNPTDDNRWYCLLIIMPLKWQLMCVLEAATSVFPVKICIK